MILKDKIVSIKPRENSGSTSSSRFDYQKDWSICKLIECHKSSSDYLVVFDWHEDLIIMDSEHNPQQVSFYQIKGKKSGNWSMTQLLESKKDKKGNNLLSVIGKLYDCKSKFDMETTSLNFVSNARFNVKLSSNLSSMAKDFICIIELTDKDKNEIKKKLKSEHNLTTEPIFEDITFLRVVDLSLSDSQGHTKGKISDFLETLYPQNKFNIPSVYRMLFDEVKRRASFSKEVLTYSDLISKKAIGKSQFIEIINATGINKNYDEIWIRMNNELQNDGLPFTERKDIQQSWQKMEIERMNPNNAYLFNIIEITNNIIIEYKNQGSLSNLSLRECLDTIYKSFMSKNLPLIGYDTNFIKAIILSVLYE